MMLDKENFAKGMTFLSIALHAEKQLSNELLEVYYSILNTMTNKAFETAIYKVSRSRTYMSLPSPGEILQHDTTKEEIFSGTREIATEMYKKFISLSSSMLDYCTENRAKISSDRMFFINTDYKNLKQTDGSSTLTKQEIYVLTELGNAEFLLNIHYYQNSNDVIEKIEKIIKKAKLKKIMGAIEQKKEFALLN